MCQLLLKQQDIAVVCGVGIDFSFLAQGVDGSSHPHSEGFRCREVYRPGCFKLRITFVSPFLVQQDFVNGDFLSGNQGGNHFIHIRRIQINNKSKAIKLAQSS